MMAFPESCRSALIVMSHYIEKFSCKLIASIHIFKVEGVAKVHIQDTSSIGIQCSQTVVL